VHAPLLDHAALPPGLVDADIRTSALRRVVRGHDAYKYVLPLLPHAIERFDLSGFDVVLTSHHAFANRVRVPDGVPVISYTHTPARWMWQDEMRASEWGGRAAQLLLGAFAATQRGPDREAASRLAGVVANSRHVADRIARWWRREALVIPPPVDTTWFVPDGREEREDFFLLAGRLVPYKRPDVAIAAARLANVHLVVAGEGRARTAVERLAGPRTEFIGRVDDDTLRRLYRRCRALLFPGEEDFGIIPVEAQACGTPVIAPAVGGVLDTVVAGTTGLLYDPGVDPVASLAAVLRGFDPDRFDPAAIRSHAQRFAPERFRARFARAVDVILNGGARPAPPSRDHTDTPV
jgi:glycosyltransferase involved in cell wall biosynthesis